MSGVEFLILKNNSGSLAGKRSAKQGHAENSASQAEKLSGKMGRAEK